MTLNQAQGIQETASLPDATGLPIGWNTDFYPTVPSTLPQPTSSSSSSSFHKSSTAIASSSNTSTEPTPAIASNNPSPPYPTGFSTSAKIGTAIGASVFGIILLALVGFFILRRRRSQPKEKQQRDDDLGHGPGSEKEAPPPSGTTPDPDPPHTIGVAYGRGSLDVSQLSITAVTSPGPSELENKAARPWSMISELDNGYDGGSSGGGGGGGQAYMEAIMEARSHGQNVGHGHTRAHSEPGPSELEAPRGVVELPG